MTESNRSADCAVMRFFGPAEAAVKGSEGANDR